MKGKYISLTPNKEIVQTWALQSPTWPSGNISSWLFRTDTEGLQVMKLR